jgi:Protein of unknown function, DUF488
MTRSVSSRIKLKRVYDPVSRADGTRILVDRLWPRGLRKEETWIDHWIKDLAPSTALRKWFCHDIELGQSFANDTARRSLARRGPITCCSERGTNSTTMRSFCASCSPGNSQARQGPKQLASRAEVGLRGEYLTSSRWCRYAKSFDSGLPLRV